MNGKRYAITVSKDGQNIGEGFVDWFADDEAAKAGLREGMEEQDYEVDRVEVTEGTATIYLKGGAK